jgi:hypothetical protein
VSRADRPLSRVADAFGHARERRDERGRERVGEEDREVEAACAPLARFLKDGGRSARAVAGDEEVVDEVRARENPLGPRARRQRQARAWEEAAQRAQRGHGHHRVAHPVRAAHHDALDIVRLQASTHGYRL